MSPSDPPRFQPNPSPATSAQTMGLAAVLTALGAVVVARARTRPGEAQLLEAARRVLTAVLPPSGPSRCGCGTAMNSPPPRPSPPPGSS